MKKNWLIASATILGWMTWCPAAYLFDPRLPLKKDPLK